MIHTTRNTKQSQVKSYHTNCDTYYHSPADTCPLCKVTGFVRFLISNVYALQTLTYSNPVIINTVTNPDRATHGYRTTSIR